MLGVPLVMSLGSVVTQPALDEDTSADAGSETAVDVGSTVAAEDTTATTDVDADADSSTDWEAASLETEADSDQYASEDSGSTTGSLSASTETDDELAPIAAGSVDRGEGIDPFDGRLAVGAIRTIAGLNGINLRYFVSDNFAIGGSAGVALFSYKENDPQSSDPACPDAACSLEDTRTVAFMAFNIEGLYFLHLGREAGALPFRADFGFGGRFGVMTSANASDVNNNLDDPTELHVEIPIVFQLMFGNNFALSPELGMDFRIVPGSREDGDSNPGVNGTGGLGGFGADSGPGFGWDLTPGVGLFGGASMHYYF